MPLPPVSWSHTGANSGRWVPVPIREREPEVTVDSDYEGWGFYLEVMEDNSDHDL